MDTYSFGYNTSTFVDMPISHKIFLAQFDTVKKIADEVNGPEKLHAMLASKDPEAAKKYPAGTDRQGKRRFDLVDFN